MTHRLARSPKTLAVLVASIAAVGLAAGAYMVDVWPRVENDSVDLRFGLRSPQRSSEVVVVAIDDTTFSKLKLRWPFPRRLHAAVIDRLRSYGARVIVYDVQFTERSDPRDDTALFESIARASRVVLATTEVDEKGETSVLGGNANVTQARAVAAAANLPAEAGGVIRRYPDSALGIESLAVAAARVAGHPISRARFDHGSAWIDFRGPPGTIRTVSFSDVLRGRVDPHTFAGKVVVVGVSAPTLQDVHQTSTTSGNPMAGPEIQASAIWTALHGNPLRPAPPWLAIIAILLGGVVAPLASLRFRVLTATMIAFALAGTYLMLAQVIFDSGTILVVTYPLAAWVLGTVGMIVASYVAAFIERNAFSLQLRESQLELIERLAQAVESRDMETGEHIKRIATLCERLALAIGWTAAESEMLRHASAMHDIGKIGIPDRVLLKPGKLDPEERTLIQSHTTTGGEILSNSANPLVQMAENIARSHHEHWDGSGYPAGLKGAEIPLVGRICAVCDVYDALTSKRPYKDPWRSDQALEEIRRGSATHFDPRLVDAFLALAPALAHELDSRTATDTASSTVPATA